MAPAERKGSAHGTRRRARLTRHRRTHQQRAPGQINAGQDEQHQPAKHHRPADHHRQQVTRKQSGGPHKALRKRAAPLPQIERQHRQLPEGGDQQHRHQQRHIGREPADRRAVEHACRLDPGIGRRAHGQRRQEQDQRQAGQEQENPRQRPQQRPVGAPHRPCFGRSRRKIEPHAPSVSGSRATAAA